MLIGLDCGREPRGCGGGESFESPAACCSLMEVNVSRRSRPPSFFCDSDGPGEELLAPLRRFEKEADHARAHCQLKIHAQLSSSASFPKI
jgi:hypothetical protein